MKKGHILKIIIIILNLILLYRIYNITILKHQYYTEKYASLANREVEGYSAPRGRIIDDKGHILVDNQGIKILVYNKIPDIKEEDELYIATKLAEVITIDAEVGGKILRKFYYDLNKHEIDKLVDNTILEKYHKRQIGADQFLDYKYSLIDEDILANINKTAAYLYNEMNRGYLYQDKVLKSNISAEEFTRINELDLPGIRFDIRWVRKFNYDTCLNVLFGSVGPIAKEDIEAFLNKGYKMDDIVGVSFLEKYYEETLRGEKARYKVRDNYTLEKISEEKRGSDIILAIDIDTQMISS